jgi:hypothetical protein
VTTENTTPHTTLTLVIDTEGVASLHRLADITWPALRKDWVGGWLAGIGGLYRDELWTCYVDEEGEQKNLPVNEIATALVIELGWHGHDRYHPLVGPAVFLGRDRDAADVDVPAAVVEHARRTGLLPPVAAVAEYHREAGGDVLFRVMGTTAGIVYVRQHPDGTLTGETFAGRRLDEVPADARAAVEAYELPPAR